MNNQINCVFVESSARLHLGFYNFFTDGVAYGGLGLAIEKPKIVARVCKSDEPRVVNRTGVDVSDAISHVLSRLGIKNVFVEILEAIPRHVGLGSTTQTMLSIGYAVSKLFGFGYGVEELAVLLGRGRDSGIGIATFKLGGFIVDSGRRVGEGPVEKPASVLDLPKPIFRCDFPRNWSIIVFIPKGRRGFDEKSERKAMDYPQPLPKDIQFELYKLVLLHIIPSIMNSDINTFGKALTKLQIVVGEYFSKYQGGVFCCEESEHIVNAMLKHGAKGVGQSSWGPTVYGIVEDYSKAVEIASKVASDATARGYTITYNVVAARNRGASLVFE